MYLHGRTVEVQCAAPLFFSRQGSADRRLLRPAQLSAAHAPAGRHLRFLDLHNFAEKWSCFRLHFVQRVIAAYRASFFLPVSRGSWFRAFLTQYGFLTHYSYLAAFAPDSALSCAARHPPPQMRHGAYSSPRGRWRSAQDRGSPALSPADAYLCAFSEMESASFGAGFFSFAFGVSILGLIFKSRMASVLTGLG